MSGGGHLYLEEEALCCLVEVTCNWKRWLSGVWWRPPVPGRGGSLGSGGYLYLEEEALWCLVEATTREHDPPVHLDDRHVLLGTQPPVLQVVNLKQRT